MTKERNVGPIMYPIYGRYEYVIPITYSCYKWGVRHIMHSYYRRMKDLLQYVFLLLYSRDARSTVYVLLLQMGCTTYLVSYYRRVGMYDLHIMYSYNRRMEDLLYIPFKEGM